MRIALVITELEPGGAEQCITQLAIFLKRSGHEVRLFMLDRPPGRRKLVDQLEEAGVEWRAGNAAGAWSLLRVTWWLRRELRDFRPQLVQAMLFHANTLAAVASLGQPWPLIGGARVRPPQRLRSLIQRWAAWRMTRMVCVSQSVAVHCRVHEKIAAEKLVTIANGIDFDSLAAPPGLACDPATNDPATNDPATNDPATNDPEGSIKTEAQLPRSPTDGGNLARIPDQVPWLLFCGRLDPQKGILELMHRAGSLLAQLPQHHLVLVGHGPLREPLEELAGNSPYASRIHLVGWQPNPMYWMRRSELLLLPAKYEGMPNVILEAMAVGRPVVVFAVDGTRELLGESPEAARQLIPAGDWPRFLTRLAELANDAQTRAALGRHNLQRVQSQFQLQDQLNKYQQLYVALIGETDA